jgi:hypothetical protein
MFRSREFAGYLRFPIPHPLDARVLTAITDSRMRNRMNPGDSGILAVFSHRKAVEAVRKGSATMLKEGFSGAAAAIELNGDIREVFLGLVVLFHCARLLHVADKEVIEWIASSGFSPEAVETIQGFSRRSERDRSLAAFHLREQGSGENFMIR